MCQMKKQSMLRFCPHIHINCRIVQVVAQNKDRNKRLEGENSLDI